MRQPIGKGEVCMEVMIPARNEEHNLGLVIPPIVLGGAKVTVFDDESTDGTGDLAESLGAQVVRPEQPLPKGWTGKNRACHELSLLASADWVVFLDADTIPSAEFISVLSRFLATRPPETKVVSGFPWMLPGRGIEPAYLGWVPWILLATNPFGLVAQVRVGHNRFTNGQVVAWRRETLQSVRPFEALRSEILEDVKIGRMLARQNLGVELIRLSSILKVRMYWSLREAIDGMSKNSADIGGGLIGSTAFAFFLIVLGWAWVLGGHLWWVFLALLLLSKAVTDWIVKAPFWTFVFIPFTCLAAALTVFRSLAWKRKGVLKWKGRTYGDT